MESLRGSMRQLKLKKDKIRRQTFMSMVENQDRSFSKFQLQQAFDAVDTDGSGSIGAQEWKKFVGKDKISSLAKHAETVQQVSEIMEKMAPVKARRIWDMTKPTLETIEAILKRIRNAIDTAKRKLSDTKITLHDLDRPSLPSIEKYLRRILRDFVNMRKPKLLLTRLHDNMFEIYILLPQLRLKPPKIKSVDLRILQTMWPSLDTPLEQIKVFLVYKISDLHLSIEAPAVKYGGWFMKLKFSLVLLSASAIFR